MTALPEWWMSFAGDDGFLGVAIVSGATFDDALRETWRLKINPGGEVMAYPLSESRDPNVAKLERNKLLSRAELERAMAVASIRELEEEQAEQKTINTGSYYVVMVGGCFIRFPIRDPSGDCFVIVTQQLGHAHRYPSRELAENDAKLQRENEELEIKSRRKRVSVYAVTITKLD